METLYVAFRIVFVIVGALILVLFVTKEAASRQSHVQVGNEPSNQDSNEDPGYPATLLSKVKAYSSSAKKEPKRAKRSIKLQNYTVAQAAKTVEAATTTNMASNCYTGYTKLEIMVFMGLIMLVVLCFLTCFIFIFLLQDRFCFGKRKRRTAIHRQSAEPFTPCKWWMSKDDDDAHNLSELFHDRVSKLRSENHRASNGDLKEYMHRLLPGCDQEQKLSCTETKVCPINEKKLLISVPRRESSLTYHTDDHTNVQY